MFRVGRRSPWTKWENNQKLGGKEIVVPDHDDLNKEFQCYVVGVKSCWNSLVRRLFNADICSCHNSLVFIVIVSIWLGGSSDCDVWKEMIHVYFESFTNMILAWIIERVWGLFPCFLLAGPACSHGNIHHLPTSNLFCISALSFYSVYWMFSHIHPEREREKHLFFFYSWFILNISSCIKPQEYF
jgi:hypothetical protein